MVPVNLTGKVFDGWIRDLAPVVQLLEMDVISWNSIIKKYIIFEIYVLCT